MECSLFGQVDDEQRLEHLLTRLKSMCIQFMSVNEHVDVFQTSTGTKSSSMARLQIDLNSSEKCLWIETAADVTQNTDTSVCCVTKAIVDEDTGSDPRDFLLCLGYIPSHSYQIQGYRFSQFKTPENLIVKVFQVIKEQPDDDVYMVKVSLTVNETGEIPSAELLVKQYSSYLSE